MGNPFDQFDTQASEGSNPFDQFDAPKKQDSALVRGLTQANSARKTFGALTTGDYESAAKLAAERDAYQRANPGTPEGNELMAAWEKGDGVIGGIKGVAGEFAKDWREAPTGIAALQATGKNLSAMGGGIVEQIPNMVMPMAGMLAGGAAGSLAGPVGTVGGAFAGAATGNTAAESAEQVDRAIRGAGINPQDTNAVRSFLEQDAGGVLGKSAIKGGIIGAVDTATMGIGGKMLRAPVSAATDRAIASLGINAADKAAVAAAREQIGARVLADPIYQASQKGAQALTRNATVGALEPVGEFAGEYLGQGVATGDWDTKGAMLEALSSLGQSGITYAGQKIYQSATSPLRGVKADGQAAPQNTPDIPPDVTLITEPTPLQQRIDAMLGLDSSRMDDKGRKQYETDLVAAFNEPIGIRLDADQKEVPFTMGEYLDAQVSANDAVRARAQIPAQSANQQASNRLAQLADEEAQHHAAITQDLVQSASQGGALSQAALTGIQTGATQMPVHPERAAIEQQMLLDEAAQAELAPVERLMRSRTDAQVHSIAQNPSANANMRKAAIADLQRRLTTQAQPTTTAPLQQTATQFNVPNGAGSVAQNKSSNRLTDQQLSDMEAEIESNYRADQQSSMKQAMKAVDEVSKQHNRTGMTFGINRQQASNVPAQNIPTNLVANVQTGIAKGASGIAQRQANAANNFINSVQEQFGLSKEDAGKAWDHFVKNKLVKIDAVGGQYTLTDGRLWDGEVIRRAANNEAQPKPKSKPGRREIDSTKDTLFQAIAKLGGMDTQELTGNGFDPKDITYETAARVSKKTGKLGKKSRLPISFGFNMPLHKKGGMSFDGMLEALKQHGYFPEDATKNDAIDAFRRELGGDAVVTPDAEMRNAEESQAEYEAEMQAEQEANEAIGYDNLNEREQALVDFHAETVYDEDNPIEAFKRGMRRDGATEEEINEQIKQTFGTQETGNSDSAETQAGTSETRNAEGFDYGLQDGQIQEGAEPDWLTGQSNEQAADQFAQQQAVEPSTPTKEQADRERDAVPFSLNQQSQPKPQGVQTGLFTADGRVSSEAKPVAQSAQDKIKSLQEQLKTATPFEKREADLNGQLIELVTKDAEQAISDGTAPAYKTGDSTFAIIHPSAQKDGMIQVTRYNEDGVFGDSQYNDVESAVRDNALWFKPRMSESEATAALDASAKAEEAYRKRRESQPTQDNPVQSNAKSDASLERTKDRNEVRFETPYIGIGGNYSLVGYVWPNKKEEYIDRRGEDRVRTVSDWEAAVENLETGRQIVHQFAVKKSDGTEQDVSAETAAKLLGVSESTVRNNAKKQLEKAIAKEKSRILEIKEADDLDAIDAQDSPAMAVSKRAMTYANGAPMIERMAKDGESWASIDNRIERESAGREKYRFLTKDGKFVWSHSFVKEGDEEYKRGWRNAEFTASEIWPAQPVKATTEAKAVEPAQDSDWLGALFNQGTATAEEDAKAVARAIDKSARVDAAIAMLTGEIDATNAVAAELAARKYKSNRKQIELVGDGPGKNASMSISAINESRRRRSIEAAQNTTSAMKKAIEFISENPDDAFKQVLDMESAVTKQFNEGFFGKSAKIEDQLDMAVGSLIGASQYSGVGSAGRKLRMAAHAYFADDKPAAVDANKAIGNPEGSKRAKFSDLDIGDRFHTGKSKGIGINSDKISWIDWEKISPSQAKAVDVHGSFEGRIIGTIENFGAGSSVFSSEQKQKPAAVDAKKEAETPKVVSGKQEGGKQEANAEHTNSLDEVTKKLDSLGIKHSIFESKGVITVSKIVVPNNEQGSGKGTEAMRLLADYADKTNKRIVLSPSSDFGGSKTRLIGFYKKFGFVENKGRNKDFSTMESMYRDAKETDKGVALYSRSKKTEGDSGLGKATIKIIKPLNKQVESILADENAQQVSVSGGNSDVVRAIAKRFGKNVIFYREVDGGRSENRNMGIQVGRDESIQGTNGESNTVQEDEYQTGGFVNSGQNGYIFLNVDSSNHLVYVLGHELGHTLRSENPALWKSMAVELQPLVRKWGEYKSSIDQKFDNESSYAEELFGDVIGQNFLNPEFWNDIAKQSPSLFTRIANAAIRVINNASKLLIGRNAIPYISDMDMARSIIAKTMAEYANSSQEQGKNTLFSKADSVQIHPITRTEAESRIKSILGDKLGKVLIDSGIVTFTNKGSEYQGATYKDGSISLNLDALNADNFAGVLQHEGFHSTIRDLVGEQTYTQMMKRLDTMLAMGKGAQWVKDADAAIPSDTKAEHRTEEIAAYSIEQYVNGAKQPNIIKRWVESLLSAIRTAIIQRMPNGKLKLWAIGNLQPQDLANLAIAGLKAKAQGQLQAQGREAMAYSIDGNVESDANYIAAINRGDIESARKMVDAKLAKLGAYWHGTPSGDLRGGTSGLHVGTRQAAMEALEARIGIPADGSGWDGTKEYGKTLLAGRDRVASGQFGKYRDTGYNSDSPRNDFFAKDHKFPTVGNGVSVNPKWKPWIRPVLIVGNMAKRHKTDSAANSSMMKLIKRGEAREGFYYKNDGEDVGSVSAVLPNGDYVRVKLADPITYDDEGNVIPLSLRFNPGNQDVRFSKINQTDTPAFKKWFGSSKVVDADGKPLVVYHGTNADFSVFKTTRSGEFGPAIYLTDNQREAGEYGEAVKGISLAQPSANIMPVYARIENPYTKGVDEFWREFGGSDSDAAGVERAKSAGYDGIIAKRADRYYDNVAHEFVDRGNTLTHYIAFSNTQVKSAIGNNGNFDGTNPDIRYSKAQIIGDSGRPYDQTQRQFFKNVGRDIEKKNLVERTTEYLKNDFWKKMAVGIVDQFRGLRDLGDNGQAYMLARLSKGTAGAFDALLHHGKLSIRDGVYDADTSGGFIDRLGTPLHGELDDFLWYVAANRAEGLSKTDRENLFTPADIAAGKSLAKGQTDFDYTIQTGPQKGTTTRSRMMIYADANRVFNEFQKNAIDMAEQSGLIDGASRKLWESEFYVPFYRVSEEDGEFIGAKMGNALVRQQAFKKLKGGTDKLNSDLLSNTLLNFSHLIEASAKNRAAKASLAAAEKVGAAQRVAPDMASYAASNGSMLPPGTKRTVWFQENGNKVEYKVTDPFVMTAITSLEYAGMNNGIMGAMSKFKHYLTIGVTASPAFKVRNLIRDSLQAIGTSDLSYNPIKNVTEGFKQTKRGNQDYVSALASGGLIRFGTMLEGSESSRVRQLIRSGVKDSTILNSENKWQAFFDKFIEPGIEAYNELGNRSEEINRAALYNQLIKQGKSHAEAALLARDLMDFSMQGSFTSIRMLTQVVPFMNARLQGLYKLGRAAHDDPRKMAIVTGAVAMASIALMLAYDDDDDWKRREDWDRDTYWWFKVGGVEYRIPKPFELGAVASLAERGLELMMNDEMTGERFRKVTSNLILNQLAMNPIPQAFKPIVDLYANKDSFTGRPIESMGMERLDPTERFNSSTSMLARGLSNATMGAMSPVQYDHLARAYFGWLGSFVVGGADMALRSMSNEPTKPALDYYKFATQGMAKEAGTGGSRYLTQLYDQAKELEQAYSTYRHLMKDGRIEEAKQYGEENKDKLMRYKQVEGVKRIESKFNEQIHRVERSDADAETKKASIERIQRQKEIISQRIAPGYQ